MQTFESRLKKVYYKNGNLKEYNASLGVNSQINDDRFHENENGKMVCDVLICFPDEYEKFHHEHEESQSQIQSLKNEISEKDKAIESMRNQLSSIDEEHSKKIKELDDEYSAKIDELNRIIHEKDIEIERTKTKYEKEIGCLKEDHQKELNALKLYDEDYHMRIQDHQSEVSDIKDKHQKEFSGIKDQITRETIHHNDNLNSLGNALNLKGLITGRQKKEYEKLKEDIEQFRQIAQYLESRENAIPHDIKIKEDDDDSS